jgi:hypothetical protein
MAEFLRGAKPTPRHKLQASTPFHPLIHGIVAPPTEFAVVPPQLSMWGNDQYGDCVTAEEAYAKAAYSVMIGIPETLISTEEVVRWATKYGFRDGADLTEVMDEMKIDGLAAGGVNYKDGPYLGVDYSNESTLQAAISQGPVKIGIDANALPSGAGNNQGWHTLSTGHYGNEDHCVTLTGYGSATFLYGKLGVSLPSDLPGTTPGYLLFTWSTIGFVTHGWIMGTCGEAWLRNPTTTGQSPPAPPNPPSPPTPPSPPGPPPPPAVVSHGTAQTQPYSFHSGGIFGSTITIPGQTIPLTVTSAPTFHGIGLAGPSVGTPNYLSLLNDILSLTQTPEFKKVIADLGL